MHLCVCTPVCSTTSVPRCIAVSYHTSGLSPPSRHQVSTAWMLWLSRPSYFMSQTELLPAGSPGFKSLKFVTHVLGYDKLMLLNRPARLPFCPSKALLQRERGVRYFNRGRDVQGQQCAGSGRRHCYVGGLCSGDNHWRHI